MRRWVMKDLVARYNKYRRVTMFISLWSSLMGMYYLGQLTRDLNKWTAGALCVHTLICIIGALMLGTRNSLGLHRYTVVSDGIFKFQFEATFPHSCSDDWYESVNVEREVADYCYSLIYAHLPKVPGCAKVHLKRWKHSVSFYTREELIDMYYKLCPSSYGVPKGLYLPMVRHCLVSYGQNLHEARANCLHEMLHAYTSSETECTFLTAYISYLSKDQHLMFYTGKPIFSAIASDRELDVYERAVHLWPPEAES